MSDLEIKKIKDYRLSCLKYQKGMTWKKTIKKEPRESNVCYICDIVYETQDLLNRHNQRRHSQE